MSELAESAFQVVVRNPSNITKPHKTSDIFPRAPTPYPTTTTTTTTTHNSTMSSINCSGHHSLTDKQKNELEKFRHKTIKNRPTWSRKSHPKARQFCLECTQHNHTLISSELSRNIWVIGAPQMTSQPVSPFFYVLHCPLGLVGGGQVLLTCTGRNKVLLSSTSLPVMG